MIPGTPDVHPFFVMEMAWKLFMTSLAFKKYLQYSITVTHLDETYLFRQKGKIQFTHYFLTKTAFRNARFFRY